MPDLVLLVPSRGRPQNVARLVEACDKTCRTDMLIHFGFDEDDVQLGANLVANHGGLSTVLPRMGLAAWTNQLAGEHLDSRWLCSIGDDMVPVTSGWDERLCEAAGPAGMSYPNDKRRDDIPECIVMSASLVAALGWICQPGLDHWYVDNVWRDLGQGGILRYLPDVVVEHRHPNVTGEPGDRTYADAAERYGHDLAAYQKWRLRDMARDVAAVRRVRAAAADSERYAGSPD